MGESFKGLMPFDQRRENMEFDKRKGHYIQTNHFRYGLAELYISPTGFTNLLFLMCDTHD